MLPRPLSSFVGRDVERRQVLASVREHALTTLVGPPGVGKTRLAVECLRDLAAEFDQRCWFVDLAAIDVAALVAPTILAAVDAPTRGGNAAEDIARYVEGEPAILLIDNCEHLLAAVIELTVTLLGRCSQLHVLATSRSELAVDGERVLTVQPFEATPGLPQQSDAVQLFSDRARARGVQLCLDDTELGLIAGICAQLDGLPLAIELAAARARVLSLAELDALLADPLDVLTGEPPRSATLQRSLSDSISWSFRLCSDDLQRALEALSVFSGSFDRAACEQVLAAVGLVSRPFDLIDALVSRSLLQTVPDDGPIRYRLLQVVRAFARERLHQRGDEEAVGDAHAAWYGRIGAELETGWVSAGQADRLQAAERDLSNIREAASRAIALGRPAQLRGLVLLPSAELWWATGRLQEGIYWLRRTAGMTGLSAELRIRTLILAGTFAYGLRLIDEGDGYVGELTRTVAGLDDPYTRGAHAYVRGFGQIQRGDPEQAICTLGVGMQIADADPELIRMSLRTRQLLVYAYNLLGRDDQAGRCCEEIVAYSTKAQESYFLSFAHQMFALYAWRRADREAAHGHVTVALDRCLGFPNRPENIDLLIVRALLEERWGDSRRAEILLAAAGHADQVELRPATATAIDVAEAVAGISARTTAAARTIGASMTAREAIVFAQGRLVPPESSDHVALTPRESEVAHLITEGLANKQIARALGLSPKTVEGHIARLMSKLGVSSRVQVATWNVDRATGD